MVEKAIASLLKFNSRVVIPEFGAVIKNLDFSQKAFFNQFIKFDDRLLMSYLMDTAGLSRDKAEAEIFAFITSVTRTIESGHTHYAEGLGYFCLQEGRVELYSSLDEIPLSSPPLKTQPVREETRARVSDPEPYKAPEPAEAPAVEPVAGDVYPEEEPVNTADEFPYETAHNFHQEHEHTEDTSRRKQVWIGACVAAAIIALIAGVAVYGPVHFGDERNDGAVNKAAANLAQAGMAPAAYTADDSAEEPENLPDTGETDTNPATTGETTPPTREQETMFNRGYHVIIGAFKNEGYADRLVRNCQRTGIEARKLQRLNDDFFLVSYAKFESLERAKEAHQTIARQYAGAWLIGEPQE